LGFGFGAANKISNPFVQRPVLNRPRRSIFKGVAAKFGREQIAWQAK
jgi:hypothetical protein